MTDRSLSPAVHALVAGLANHLWQSTLTAIVAGLLTLALRKHHARARYWLWLAASMKFLVPFSLLVSLGSHLGWQRQVTATVRPALYVAVEQISQPFASNGVRTSLAPAQAVGAGSLQVLPWIAAVWFSGFVAVVLLWAARWLRISAAIRAAVPLEEGREVGILRRLERRGGVRKSIVFLLSRASLEPGIFGIARPALIWPEGISKHLEDPQLEAVLAHEVWHVRRRDNLAAVLHMLVEAVFWFYPLVWWLGSRLVEERERACDEEVVSLGGDRQVYAEGILKVCEFCLGSPLPCVAGVTGADLKKRMVHIMNDRILHNLGFARKFLLTAAAALAIAIPVAFGLLHPTPGRAQEQTESATSSTPVYSSVSIKPSAGPNGSNLQKMMFSLTDGSFVANGVTLERLIQLAYRVQAAQISGPQDLLNNPKFDVEAKLAPAYVQQMSEHKGQPDRDMLRSILTDRFKLVTHFEARTVPAYDLVVADGGAKLQPSQGQQRMFHVAPAEFASSGAPLDLLTTQLSARLGRPVVDKTGLKGTYAFHLHWMLDPAEEENLKQSGEWAAPVPAPESNGPPLATALEEQLGLKLQPNNEPVQMLVVDHVEQPAEN